MKTWKAFSSSRVYVNVRVRAHATPRQFHRNMKHKWKQKNERTMKEICYEVKEKNQPKEL